MLQQTWPVVRLLLLSVSILAAGCLDPLAAPTDILSSPPTGTTEGPIHVPDWKPSPPPKTPTPTKEPDFYLLGLELNGTAARGQPVGFRLNITGRDNITVIVVKFGPLNESFRYEARVYPTNGTGSVQTASGSIPATAPVGSYAASDVYVKDWVGRDTWFAPGFRFTVA